MAKKKEIELTDDLLTLMSMLNFGELPNANSDVHIPKKDKTKVKIKVKEDGKKERD